MKIYNIYYNDIIKLQDMINIEKMRYDILDFKFDVDVENNYFINKFKNHELYVLTLCYQNNICSVVYISNVKKSLYIEYLFTNKDYLNKGYAYALMQYVLKNKHIFEKFFDNEICVSRLEAYDECINFYKKLGYINSRNYSDEYVRRLI